MIPERLAPSRPINRPIATIPASAGPVMYHNNIQLVPKPNLSPPQPAIISPLIGTGTGYQFSFNQVTVPPGATNVISGYKVYRNTQNFQGGSQLVAMYPHTAAKVGPIVHSDHLMTIAGKNYYYWVSSVDTTGQESTPKPAQTIAVPGNAGVIPFSQTTGFKYTATTTSISWFWDGTNGSSPINIYRADGTVTGPISGNQTITGLNPTTNYNFYPYYDEPTQNIKWVAGGVGTPGYAQTAGSLTLVQSQALRNRIPLSSGGMVGTTPTTGTSSGSGGGAGGGGGNRGNLT